MKPFDLESQIKSVRVPERDAEFWQSLPHRVLEKAQAAPHSPSPSASPPFSLFSFQNLKFLFAALLLGFFLWHGRLPVTRALLKDGRQVRMALVQFHDGLNTLMRDEHGLQNLVQDPP
jgi:hypothetical protein